MARTDIPFESLFEDAISDCIGGKSAEPLRSLLDAYPDFDHRLRAVNTRTPPFFKDCMLRLVKRGPAECLQLLDERHCSFPGWDRWADQLVTECLDRDRVDILAWLHKRGALRALASSDNSCLYTKSAALNAINCAGYLVTAGYAPGHPKGSEGTSLMDFLCARDASAELINACIEAGARNETVHASEAITNSCLAHRAFPDGGRKHFQAIIRVTPAPQIPFDSIAAAKHLGPHRMSAALDAVDRFPLERQWLDDRVLELVPKARLVELIEKGADPRCILSFAARRTSLQSLVPSLYKAGIKKRPRDAAMDSTACATPAGAKAALQEGFDPWRQRPGEKGLPWMASYLVRAFNDPVSHINADTLASLVEAGTPLLHPRTNIPAIVSALELVLSFEPSGGRLVASHHPTLDAKALSTALRNESVPVAHFEAIGGSVLHGLARHLAEMKVSHLDHESWPAEADILQDEVFPMMVAGGLNAREPDSNGKSAVDYLTEHGNAALEPLGRALARQSSKTQAATEVTVRKRVRRQGL